MIEFLKNIFDVQSFMPHGHCFLWQPDILWMRVISDAIVALSYYMIPLVLFIFARKRTDLPFVWMFLLFSLFILLCGTTHIIDIVTLWQPVYRFQGIVKALTAAVSIITAVLLIPLLPQLLALRSPAELEAKNLELLREMDERKNAERIITEQQAKLINAAKLSALGEMAGGVAHEINTPLTVIKLRANQVDRLLLQDPPDVDKARQLATTLESTADHIGRVVQGLQTFSRHSPHDPITNEPLNEIVAKTLDLCTQKFKHHDIALDIIGKTDAMVKCRPAQISQVLLNLLNNAKDAVEGLAERRVKITFIEDQDTAGFIVSDSGKGIAHDIEEKLFQPFFTTKDVGKGTGLGLSISKGIIEDHGGSIYLDRINGYTSFVIKLPKGQRDRVA